MYKESLKVDIDHGRIFFVILIIIDLEIVYDSSRTFAGLRPVFKVSQILANKIDCWQLPHPSFVVLIISGFTYNRNVFYSAE